MANDTIMFETLKFGYMPSYIPNPVMVPTFVATNPTSKSVPALVMAPPYFLHL
jgi:hypothetical protein